MGQRERIAVWACLVLLLIGGAVGIVTLYGEIADLRAQVELAVGARPPTPSAWGDPTLPTAVVNQGGAGAVTVRVLAVSQPVTATAVISMTVRGSGAVDPLLDLPVLECAGRAHPVDGPSLEQARQDLLALITRGEATVSLTFTGAPQLGQPCTLVLNPSQPADGLAPRIAVAVPARVGGGQ